MGKKISIRLTDPNLEYLKRLAEELDITRTEALNMILKEYSKVGKDD